MPDTRRGSATVASVVVGILLLAACTIAPTPSATGPAASVSASSGSLTRYETALYTLVMPSELGLRPLNGSESFVWAHPDVTYAGATADRAVNFEVVPTAACSEDSMFELATRMRNGRPALGASEPTRERFGGLIGSMFIATEGGKPSVALACAGSLEVVVLGYGLVASEIRSLLEGFAFRDPPGDPAHAPMPST